MPENAEAQNEPVSSVDEAALTAAYHEQAATLRTRLRRRLSYAADADEALQEVFLRAWAARGRGITSLGGYLHGITERVALERLRERQRWGLPGNQEAALETPDSKTPEDIVAGNQICDRIEKALRGLPPARGRAWRMHVDGATQQQIAAELGVSRAMARKHIDRARMHVDAILHEKLPALTLHPGTRRGAIVLPPLAIGTALRRAVRFLLRWMRRASSVS